MRMISSSLIALRALDALESIRGLHLRGSRSILRDHLTASAWGSVANGENEVVAGVGPALRAWSPAFCGRCARQRREGRPEARCWRCNVNVGKLHGAALP